MKHFFAEIECDDLELLLNNKDNKTLDRELRKRGSDLKRNRNKYLNAVESKRLSKEEKFLKENYQRMLY